MGIEALRAAVEAEGRERVAAVRREAEERAAQLRAEAEALLAERMERALRERELALRRELGSRLTAARRVMRAEELGARDAFLDRVFEAAERALPDPLAAPGVRATFEARLRQALSHLPRPLVIRCPPARVADVEAAIAGGAGLRVESDPEIAAGFCARAAEVDLEVDATLSTLLAFQRPRLAIEVLRRLDAIAEQGSG